MSTPADLLRTCWHSLSSLQAVPSALPGCHYIRAAALLHQSHRMLTWQSLSWQLPPWHSPPLPGASPGWPSPPASRIPGDEG